VNFGSSLSRSNSRALHRASGFQFHTIWLVLLASFAIGSPFAQAQFSGPALPSSSAVNLPPVLTTDPAVLYPGNREIRLGPSDLLVVHIYGSVDYNPAVQVSLDGSIQLPLIGNVHVEGLTIHQAERKIADMLISAGMYRDPQVSIQLTESPNQNATLSGEVHGVVPIRGQIRLLDVMAAAGGNPQTASHILTINRPGVDQPIVVDLGTNPARSDKADIPIFPGDTIITPRTGVVYVLGAFKTQGAVPLQQNSPLTLMQLAAMSGGPGWEGKSGDLRLVRTVGTERTFVKVDLKRIMAGKDPDPVLQVDDIVFLPSSAWRSAIKNGGLGTVFGITNLLLYISTI